MGLKKSKETEKGKGLAIAGIICSIIGIIVGIAVISMMMPMFDAVASI